MRFLLIGDFQGVFSEKLFRKLKKENFDFVVGVGDYSGIKDWKPYIRRIFKDILGGRERVMKKSFLEKKDSRIC